MQPWWRARTLALAWEISSLSTGWRTGAMDTSTTSWTRTCAQCAQCAQCAHCVWESGAMMSYVLLVHRCWSSTHTHNTHTVCVCVPLFSVLFKVLFSYFSFGCLLCSDVGNGGSGRWSRKARLWNFPLSDFQGAGSRHGPWVPGSIHEKKSKLGDFQTDRQHMIFNEFQWAN